MCLSLVHPDRCETVDMTDRQPPPTRKLRRPDEKAAAKGGREGEREREGLCGLQSEIYIVDWKGAERIMQR